MPGRTSGDSPNRRFLSPRYGCYTPEVAPGTLPRRFDVSPTGCAMSRHATSGWSLENDTAVNVATLLREEIGASRRFPITLDRFALDDDLIARDVAGQLRLTRLPAAIMARVQASAGGAPGGERG